MKKKKPLKHFDVTLYFQQVSGVVKAKTEAEAKQKMFKRAIKKGYRTLVDFRDTDAIDIQWQVDAYKRSREE